MLKKAVFIDRDGTIIKEPADEQIDSLEKLEFVPGAISGLRSLMNRGYELVMVSNQDGLGTDSFPEDTFWPAHNRMLSTLEGEGVRFDDILIDRSFPEDNAPTRKPRTGMLTAYMDGSYDLANSFVVGDRLTDVQLAQNLGARGILIAPADGECPDGCELLTEDWDEIARHILSSDRKVTVERNTSETCISITLDLDGHEPSHIDSGLKFFDHMLWQLPHHAGISLELRCEGDLEVDEHHSMEDVAIALGQAIDTALGSKRGIDRYGFVLPMDECKAMVLIDFGGRADFVWDVEFTREYVGDTPTEMYKHFFKSLCVAMRCNLHISARGENNHHLIEGVFKAFARALRMAVRRDVFSYSLPSSKGVL
ncbi:bifunctional histidinol-phosphatase/imidazoleglycerol-phosphate dehydratase HisB [uncultured Duncaniella sp.]|uniref:bifunctional histidinol-phosphatase/imidazoleglycerol-phosphate dehydratase HisB n=2 Tax=uncultured Duncaniella sp. TaxID=2768039 RepID=UPI0025FBCCF8|nr:bifunctional histidinol-phosphatase/imidazoleglycerol-phosphate dehydratase HisB [uncultured Duncaniella sp.]